MRDFRIVIAGHGGFPSGLLSAAQLICGQLDEVRTVELQPSDTPESFHERLLAAMPASHDHPVLLLTDLVGGTPHNMCLLLARRRPTAVLISGVNLAVLMEAAMSLDALEADAVERLVEGGKDALAEVTSRLASRSP
jgi:mannose/fructose-specific phosphotransferase system component IIA